RGTVADQCAVPEAMPASPPDVVHFTAATPVLSLAAPPMARVAAVVETMLVPGEVTLSDGGVVSDRGLAGGVVGGGTGVGAGGGTGVGAGGGTGVGAGGGTGVGVGAGGVGAGGVGAGGGTGAAALFP